MKDRTAFIVSLIVHLCVLLYLTITPRAQFKAGELFIPVSLKEVQPEESKPEPEPKKVETPEPEPEIEKPKISEDTIRELQDHLKKTPTPKTDKPTKTPTPTSKPTKEPQPTKKPTAIPTATPNVTPTPAMDKLSLDELQNQPAPAHSVRSASESIPTFQSPDGSSYNFDPYSNTLRVLLERAWQPPSVRKPEPIEYQTVVSFTVQRDGKITDVKLEVSSGWDLLDQSVLNAVNLASPVERLPFNYTQDRVRAFFPFVFE